jgi:predicted PurR-regulated permease PerM
MHFILRNWETVTAQLVDALPLRRDYTEQLMVEFRRVGRTTLLGAVGTGLAQGALATIGYFIAGVPEPVLFGAATAVASFVPAVGTLLVFVPVGVTMILAGSTTGGIVTIAWGLVFVVAICDYVIRPRLVRGEGNAPALVTFAALFGGVEVLGLKGLVIGPVVMALAIAVLRLYTSEKRKGTEIITTS